MKNTDWINTEFVKQAIGYCKSNDAARLEQFLGIAYTEEYDKLVQVLKDIQAS